MKHQGDVTLVKYDAIDGIPTFKDSQIKLLFEKAKLDGVINRVFYNMNTDTMTSDMFLNFYKFGNMKMYVVFIDAKIVGWIWLDDLKDKAARLHYCFLKWAVKAGITEYVGVKCLDYFLNTVGYDVIRGETPVFLRLAVKYLDRLGMKIIGEIPAMAQRFSTGKTYPMVISYITRELLKEKTDGWEI